MKRINLLIPALIILAVACKHNTKLPTEAVQPTQDSLVADSYLPVADFINLFNLLTSYFSFLHPLQGAWG